MDVEFEIIYEKYSRGLFRFLLSLTANEEMAKELVSETFYQAFLHIDQFREECSVYTWLCQIGKNAWLKECKRYKRTQPIEAYEDTLGDSSNNLERTIIQKEMAARAIDILNQLGPPYTDVFLLHVYDERRFSEIAQMYEKSESWARVTFYRAKAKIVQELEDEK